MLRWFEGHIKILCICLKSVFLKGIEIHILKGHFVGWRFWWYCSKRSKLDVSIGIKQDVMFRNGRSSASNGHIKTWSFEWQLWGYIQRSLEMLTRLCPRNAFEAKKCQNIWNSNASGMFEIWNICAGAFEDAWKQEKGIALHVLNVAESYSKTVMVEVV